MGRFRRDGEMKTDGYGHTNMHTGDTVKRREGDGCMEQRERERETLTFRGRQR